MRQALINMNEKLNRLLAGVNENRKKMDELDKSMSTACRSLF